MVVLGDAGHQAVAAFKPQPRDGDVAAAGLGVPGDDDAGGDIGRAFLLEPVRLDYYGSGPTHPHHQHTKDAPTVLQGG
jgi:hypothetical protein